MSAGADGSRVAVASGSTAMMVVYTTVKTRVSVNSSYVIASRKEHSSEVNAVLMLEKGMFAGYQDGSVFQWDEYPDPVRVASAGSAVICLCRFRFPVGTNDDSSQDMSRNNNNSNDLLVCGLASGKLFVLPYVERQNLHGDWRGKLVPTGSDSTVSALGTTSNFVYSGSVSGTVRIWAVVVTSSSSSSSYLEMLNLVCVATESVHTGPVTSFGDAVGVMFSSSHDFSTVAWRTPVNEQAQSATEFKHSFSGGEVLHQSPIIALTCNSHIVVSGDEAGRIVVRAPTKYHAHLKVCGRSSYHEPKVQFSFLRFDFGDCFLPLLQGSLRESVVLTIRNVSRHPVTIRSLHTNGPCLSATVDTTYPLSYGVRVLDTEGGTGVSSVSSTSTGVELLSGYSVMYRIEFVPVEEKLYKMSLPFVTNDNEITRLYIRGAGIKPKLVLEEISGDIDFGTVTEGSTATRTVKFRNTTSKAMLVQCLGEISPLDEVGKALVMSSTGFPNYCKDNLQTRGISIIPRCALLAAKHSLRLTIEY
eukprot:gene38215-50120_t